MINNHIIDTVLEVLVPYIDLQIQAIMPQLDEIRSRLDTMNKRLDDLHIDKRGGGSDSSSYAGLLRIRELELTNENMRLQLELQSIDTNIRVDKGTPTASVLFNAKDKTETAVLSTDPPLPIEVKLAVEWIKRNPQHGWETMRMYFMRYTDASVGGNSIPSLSRDVFYSIVRKHLSSDSMH